MEQSTEPYFHRAFAGADDPNSALGEALTLEWLETNGCGGYASSTPSLCPMRRYHGLLVAPFQGTATRHLFLARFDERLLDAEGGVHALAVARYGEEFAPRGDRALHGFELAPHPVATYRCGEFELRREVRMVAGRQAVMVRYLLSEDSPACALQLRPLLPFREADALTVENEVLDPEVQVKDGGLRTQPYTALPPLYFRASQALRFEDDASWYRNLVFEADRARGYAGSEDQFCPGTIVVELEPGQEFVIAASIESELEDPQTVWHESLAGEAPARDLDARLDRAAEQFLYRTPEDRLGIVAGFPWFLEWGRDTFLALPGLTLARGQIDRCAEVLRGALPYLRDGLLPNIFGVDPSDSHYGSADAALWFARAVLLYDRAGGKRRLLRDELRPALKSIAEAYLAGTELGLKVDQEGLLHAGSSSLNPTWMDARTVEGPVTPRQGCPVEIAALWCSLLAHLGESNSSEAEREHWKDHARNAKRAFKARFWNEDAGALIDVWRAPEDPAAPLAQSEVAIRPNMVLAAALELAPLTKAQRLAIVQCAERELLTPFGLRTLARDESGYCARYEGGPSQRDSAYHQGTVWPWLMGAYIEASLRAQRPTKARLAALSASLEAWEAELDRIGLNHLSEVFDGDAPHQPGGTIAQAWNTAEWLRARRMLAEGRA